MEIKALLTALLAGTTLAQQLNIPKPNGTKAVLPAASIIAGSRDFDNREFDRGHNCALDVERPAPRAVFILEDGATISNVIIGINTLEGIHCRGSCTLRNVWFRDVCEDAVIALGPGNVLIEGGGSQGLGEKIINHQGRGTVTIKDFTALGARNLYRSCGVCKNNSGPRNIILQNVRASGITTLVGINSNFGDVSTISGSCGTGISKVCQEYQGVSSGESRKLSTTANCKGQASLPAC